MDILSERLESFKKHNVNILRNNTSDELADSGFYLKSTDEDLPFGCYFVKCFSCNLELFSFEKGDVVDFEHLSCSGFKCEFLLNKLRCSKNKVVEDSTRYFRETRPIKTLNISKYIEKLKVLEKAEEILKEQKDGEESSSFREIYDYKNNLAKYLEQLETEYRDLQKINSDNIQIYLLKNKLASLQ
jgi:hypothetical protein